MTETPARRSDRTRAAILVAARERFAADGYERATIRSIAADARIDPAMVMRYFGSKEKLFAAAAELDLRLPDLSAVPNGQVGTALARHFVERWDGDETLTALLRAAVTNEAAAERIRQIFATQMGAVVAQLTDTAEDTAVRADLAASQVLGVALCRYVLAFPAMAAMTSDEVAAWLGPTLQRSLTGRI